MKAKNDLFWFTANEQELSNEVVSCLFDFYNYQSIENIDSWCSTSNLAINDEDDYEKKNENAVMFEAVYNYCKHCFEHFEGFKNSKNAVEALKCVLCLGNDKLVELVWSFCEKESSFFENSLNGVLACILLVSSDKNCYAKQQLKYIKRLDSYKNVQMHISYASESQNEPSIDLLGFIYAIEQHLNLEVVLSLLKKTDISKYLSYEEYVKLKENTSGINEAQSTRGLYFFKEKTKKDFLKHQEIKCLASMMNDSIDVEFAKGHILPWFSAQLGVENEELLKECVSNANEIMGKDGYKNVNFIIWFAMRCASVSKSYEWIDFFNKLNEDLVYKNYLFLKHFVAHQENENVSKIDCLEKFDGFDFRDIYRYLTSIYEKKELECSIEKTSGSKKVHLSRSI